MLGVEVDTTGAGRRAWGGVRGVIAVLATAACRLACAVLLCWGLLEWLAFRCVVLACSLGANRPTRQLQSVRFEQRSQRGFCILLQCFACGAVVGVEVELGLAIAQCHFDAQCLRLSVLQVEAGALDVVGTPVTHLGV